MPTMTTATTPGTIAMSSGQLAAVALSTIRSVLGGERCQYLSAPITGGPRLLDWHRRIGRGLPDRERSAGRSLAVTRPNIDDVIRLAEEQRSAGRRTIEPGSFEADFPQWGQPEFYAFWNVVLERHADRATFADGWNFSAGCTFEYLCAVRHGLPTVDIRGKAIDPDTALGLIDEALSTIDSHWLREDPRDGSLAALYEGIGLQRRAIAALRRSGDAAPDAHAGAALASIHASTSLRGHGSDTRAEGRHHAAQG